MLQVEFFENLNGGRQKPGFRSQKGTGRALQNAVAEMAGVTEITLITEITEITLEKNIFPAEWSNVGLCKKSPPRAYRAQSC